MSDIRLITEPTVALIGRPTFDDAAAEAFLEAVNGLEGEDGEFPCYSWEDDNPDSQMLIESGGRMCYQSYRGGRPHAEHVRHLVAVGHTSVLEHAQYTFLAAGVSRALTHELVRHRHLSPSQLSQRYVDHGEHRLGFVVPPALLPDMAEWYRQRADPDPRTGWPADRHAAAWRFSEWRRHCRETAGAYRRLAASIADNLTPAAFRGENEEWPSGITLDEMRNALSKDARTAVRKQAREAARSVLPECAETRIQLSGNLRAWLEYFPKRCSEAADAEHRRLACKLFDLLAPEAPDVFAHLARRPLPDGTFALATQG